MIENRADLINCISELGFTKYSTNYGKDETEETFMDAPGSFVYITVTDDKFCISGGNLKYFGMMTFPECSIRRSKKDLISMISTMRYYSTLIETNQPW